jgi:hypothetical protein
LRRKLAKEVPRAGEPELKSRPLARMGGVVEAGRLIGIPNESRGCRSYEV